MYCEDARQSVLEATWTVGVVVGENVATINSKNLLNEPVVASATLPGTTDRKSVV